MNVSTVQVESFNFSLIVFRAEDPVQDMMKEMMARIQKGNHLKSSKVANLVPLLLFPALVQHHWSLGRGCAFIGIFVMQSTAWRGAVLFLWPDVPSTNHFRACNWQWEMHLIRIASCWFSLRPTHLL